MGAPLQGLLALLGLIALVSLGVGAILFVVGPRVRRDDADERDPLLEAATRAAPTTSHVVWEPGEPCPLDLDAIDEGEVA